MDHTTVTIQQVARRAGVSTATVSRALRTPDRVARTTREAVMEAVRATGYSVNRAARNLRTRQAGAVIVLVPNLGNPFFSEILSGIEAVFAEEAMNVMVLDTHGRRLDGAALIRLMVEGQGDGMICLDGSLGAASLAEFGRSPFAERLVFACEWVAGADVPSVRSDNASGVAQMIAHLAGLGHRRIGHLKGPEGNVLSDVRHLAFRDAIGRHGLALRDDWILPGEFGLEAGRIAGARLCAMQDRPTAMFCASDQQAIGMISEFQRQGLRVPQDISVAGFDDISISAYIWPGLTTVRQDRPRLGQEAARALLARLRAAPRTGPDPVIVPVSLVPRGTTAAV